jgi:hypothetical protein
LPRVFPTFHVRRHVTALPGWRAASRRRPALRDCSLVVPATGGRDEVSRLLDALLSAADAPGEVVVVDAAPSRELDVSLRRWAASAAAPFALVYVAGPPELTRQRNIGVDLSTREFVFFLDPGVLPLPGYFSATRRVFDLDTGAVVGGVAGVVVNETESREPGALLYAPSGVWTPRSYRNPFTGLRRVDVLPGCAVAWRRDVFAAHRFSCYFREHPEGEDMEFSLRAGRSWTLLCCGDARVQRIPPVSPVVPGYRDGRARVRNRYLIWRRHVSRPSPRHTASFWADALAAGAAAAADFCLCPWRPAHLARAAGILAGIHSCLADPPRFVEPPARREYTLAPDTPRLAAQSGN